MVLPTAEELVLCLIKEELKGRKFFDTLQHLGLDDSWCQPRLDDLILTCLGLNDNTDETFDYYYTVMNEHAALIDEDSESVEKQSKEAYSKLIGRRI